MKRYLKSPEEVVQALKDGKVVESEGYSYKLVNGVICSFYKQGYYKWNVGGAIFQSDEPYVDEPEQLKLEVGKFYKTRDGEKAVILAADENQSFFVAVIGKYNTFFVNNKGLACKKQLNLVAPWEE